MFAASSILKFGKRTENLLLSGFAIIMPQFPLYNLTYLAISVVIASSRQLKDRIAGRIPVIGDQVQTVINSIENET
jgi:hypothetical protein